MSQSDVLFHVIVMTYRSKVKYDVAVCITNLRKARLMSAAIAVIERRVKHRKTKSGPKIVRLLPTYFFYQQLGCTP